MTPDEIRAIRRRLDLNTKEFGALLGVSGRTVENWEMGRNKPTGPAVKIIRGMTK